MSSHLAVKLLSSYLDAEVTPTELKLVEGHLDECSECRRTVAGLRAVADGVRRLEAVAPPASLAAGVERRVARASLENRGFRLEESVRRWMAQPVLAPVFAIVLALASILYLFAYGVARDESRGTRFVIASAPSEMDSKSRQEPAREDDSAETVEVETMRQELLDALELPASAPSEPPAAAKAPVAPGRLNASAPAAPAAETAEEVEPAGPVDERTAAKRVDGARDADRSFDRPEVKSSAGLALGEAVPIREVGGRRFLAEGAIWVEVGLEGRVADEFLDWRHASDGASSELEALRELGRVRLSIGDRVVEVTYPEGAPPN